MGFTIFAYSRIVVRSVPAEHMRVANADGILEHRPESRAWVEAAKEDPEIISIDWGRGLIYARSPETREESMGWRYSGFADFNDKVITVLRARGLRLRFRVPDSDAEPWDGRIRGDLVQMALHDYGKATEGFRGEELEFLECFLGLLRLAADGGLLRIP